MILNNRSEEFDYWFIVRVDRFDYQLFGMSIFKCFCCGEEGHIIRACPNRADLAEEEPPSADLRPADSGKEALSAAGRAVAAAHRRTPSSA